MKEFFSWLTAEEMEEIYFGLNDQDYKELMALPTDKNKIIFLKKRGKVEEAWHPLNDEELAVFMGRKRATEKEDYDVQNYLGCYYKNGYGLILIGKVFERYKKVMECLILVVNKRADDFAENCDESL
ncbi:11779_t:CDS:2 [Diversispora eburnea]|uniref:11779_t:CDS:1 n=1 Tax=Diversispora eburnea TaxID=1213867 RepID=A0A9N9APY0_9GLOM|nr:11779_t:CDS:2 [Diversispora eburnea]